MMWLRRMLLPAARLAEMRSIAVGERILLTLQVVSLLALATAAASRTWQDRMWLGAVLAGLTLLVWLPELARARARRWWFVYVWGIFAYGWLRALADETPIPVQSHYVIEADRRLFLGHNPVTSFQGAFFSPRSVTWFDWAAVLVHWSFFVIPHAVAIAVFLFDRARFPRYALLLVGTMYAALVVFFLVPTEPPWLAAAGGDLPGVYRVMDFVGGRVDPETYREFYATFGEPNSVAAMPSVHFGVIVAMALWGWAAHRWLGAAFIAYAAITGVAIVYLGEHYVTDLVGGAATAALVRVLLRRIGPLRPY
jgi:membrane-associated phospholipid phosphatase